MTYKIKYSRQVPVWVGHTHSGSVIVYRVINGKKEIFTDIGWVEYGTIQYDKKTIQVFRYHKPGMNHPSSWRSIVSVVDKEI